MATEEWQSHSALSKLFAEFNRFSFFQAVYLLEACSSDKKPIGETLDPCQEPVRFSVKPGFSFPASEIAHLTEPDDNGPAKMDVAFMGLIGPSGVLPHWYNDLCIGRMKEKDFGIVEFLDVFHHRLISTFYRAWKKHYLTPNFIPGAKDRLSGYFLSYLGLGTGKLSEKIHISPEPLIYYSGLLSKDVTSAYDIEAVIEYFTGSNVTVDQFVERLIPLEPDEKSRIGTMNSIIGKNLTCGSYARDSTSKFRVNIGPMDYKRFVRLLPDGDMLQPVFGLIQYMTANQFEFEVRLYLKKEEVPLCILGPGETPRLGWTMWAMSPGMVLRENPHVTFQKGQI